jgi:hypothetical protein
LFSLSLLPKFTFFSLSCARSNGFQRLKERIVWKL